MKFFRLDLLTLLISLFILNSCKNKDTIGLGLNSSTQLGGSLIDTATIVVNTFKEDSVVTTNLAKTPLGYFIDPVLGTTESNIAIGLNLPASSAYTLPTGTISIDSAVLVLRYADGFYGDSITSNYKVNVYQLGVRPLAKTYYSNTNWTSNLGSLVGTRSFFPHTHDSIKIMNIITGAPDSLIKVAPQLRIPIDKTFINNILFNAGSAQLASNVVFQNNVKGLYITLDKSGTTGAGGTMMFTLSDSLNVYYHAVNGTTIDTAMVSLPLSTSAAEIKHTFSTAVNTDINDTTRSKDLIYLQGLAGTKVRIKFPYLKNIIKNVGNIVINRAELVVTPLPTSMIPLYLKAQPKLTMYRYDIAHQRAELEDASQSDTRYQGVGTFGGYYSSSLKNYHFIVTAYVQDLMNGKTVDYGTYLAPVDTTNKASVDISPTPQTAGRTIVVGTDKTSINAPYSIKLNIIYTKINK
ncbi:MAG: hypothetical protein JWR54_3135, partial [Mucilaginibacter sp.]|nr:hypothetical protein [Mucilaginibacter sp.]